MKPKLWERTAYRIVLFILCALFASASLSLVAIGEKRLADAQMKYGRNNTFEFTDVLTARNFMESNMLKQAMWTKLTELTFIYDNFVGDGGLEIESGALFERAFDEMISDIYERIKYRTIEQESFGLPPEDLPPETLPPEEMLSESETDSFYFSEMYIWHDGWGSHGRDELFEFNKTKMLNDPVLAQDGKLRSFSAPGVREAFMAMFPDQIAGIRERIAYERRAEYQNSMSTLGDSFYYVMDTDTNKGLSNVELDAVRYQRAWVMNNAGNVSSSIPGFVESNYTVEYYSTTYLIALPDDTLAKYEKAFLNLRQIIVPYFFIAMGLLALSVCFFIMLLVYTGRKRPSFEDTRRLWKLDKMFVEFQIVLFIISFAAGSLVVERLMSISKHSYTSIYGYTINGTDITTSIEPGIIPTAIVFFAILIVLLWFLLSLVRLLKAGLFAERSLIARLITGPCKRFSDTIKSGYDGRNPLAKTLIVVILFWCLTAFFAGLCGLSLSYSAGMAIIMLFFLLLTLAGASCFSYKWVKRYGRLRKGVEEITGGDLDYKIEISGDGKNEFDRLSAMVNELGSAQNTAIQNELKNQRLKTDLISNVSHDLKTPLTSIITYTDLLKTEGLKSKNAEEYLQIIDEKSRKLQKLTEDLFDAAKASSGAIQVRKEKVDLLALIGQEIAEFNGSFTDADLDLVINAENEHYYVEADGQLLWRVVDNLLRNVCKYAQPGTRVYLDFKEHHSAGQKEPSPLSGATLMTTLEIKNISASKLNIPPEELMERFKRGDESRATEGSGLGLAIAKDLVRLQGGWFEIFIDGDLFKAVVMLPPYNEE